MPVPPAPRINIETIVSVPGTAVGGEATSSGRVTIAATAMFEPATATGAMPLRRCLMSIPPAA